MVLSNMHEQHHDQPIKCDDSWHANSTTLELKKAGLTSPHLTSLQMERRTIKDIQQPEPPLSYLRLVVCGKSSSLHVVSIVVDSTLDLLEAGVHDLVP